MIKKLKIVLFLLSFALLVACGGNVETDLPNAPTAVRAISAANAIKLSWKDNSKIETGFVIYREELNAAGLRLVALSKLAEVAADTQEYTDTEVDVNKTYRYSVTAKNALGENPTDPNDNRTPAVQATPSEGFRLTINRPGSGAGTITSSPAGINCNYETGQGCDFVFAQGTTVSLTVTPNSDSEFQGWDVEGCEGTGVCEITVNATTTVAVVMLRTKATLTVDTSLGTGQGRITSIPQGIDCGDTCSFSWNTPIEVFLTATADAATGSSFIEWQGCPKVEGSSGQFCRVKQTDPGLVKIGARFNLPAPVIRSFVSDVPKVAEGGSATLSWDIDDRGNQDVSLVLTQLPASSVEPQIIDISAKALRDTLLVSPTVSTTYSLIATSASGDSEKRELIVSIGDETTISFNGTDTNPADSTPETIDVTPTDTVRLSWTIAGEAPFTLSLTKTTGAAAPVAVDITGKDDEADFVDVIPGASSIYTLTVTNSLGVESIATLSVEVGSAPVISSFTLEGGDLTVASGSTIKLDWAIASAAPVTAQTLTENAAPIIVAPAARTFSKPLSTPTDTPETFSYELAATNRFGSSAKSQLTLTVGKPAVVSSLLTPDANLLVGSLVPLEWTATGSEPITFRIRRSTSLVATLSDAERSADVPGLASPGFVTYSIVADNAYGPTSAAQSVEVRFGNVPTISAFTATAGISEVLLDWTIDFASEATNSLSLRRTDPDTVVRTVPVTPSTPTPYSDSGLNPAIETYTYTLIATNEFGSSAPSIRLVGPPPP